MRTHDFSNEWIIDLIQGPITNDRDSEFGKLSMMEQVFACFENDREHI